MPRVTRPADPPRLRPAAEGPTRREALALMSAGVAALVAGCRRRDEYLVPYIAQPEGLVPGRADFFATTLPLGGLGRGVVVESHEGRPTKVHGNPAHPASLGATDVFAEAAILDLFDPARPRAPERDGRPSSWLAFEEELARTMPDDGDGARLLTGPVTSPTTARQIATLLARRPAMRWHVMEPPPRALETGRGANRRGIVPDFARAGLVVSLGCDFLGAGPEQIATARAFVAARAPRHDALRLTVFEPAPTLTGAKADRRVSASMADLARLAEWLDARLGDAKPTPLPQRLQDEAERLAAQLARAGTSRAMILAAPELPPRAARAVARLNARLAAPLAYRPAADRWPDLEPGALLDLVTAMRGGEVRSLVVLDVDPVFSTPAVIGFADALAGVPFIAQASIARTDTAAFCHWQLPLAHPLEDWSDLRGPDGTVGLVQPLIAPLHGSRSRHELLDLLANGPAAARPARAIVEETWRGTRSDTAFAAFWTAALHEGLVPDTALPTTTALEIAAPDDAAPPADMDGFELLLRPAPSVWTGEAAGNAWLQECPEPVTKQVWGNALWMAPADVLRLALADGDGVRLATPQGAVEVPVLSVRGQHHGTLSLALGYGRAEAGPIGTGIGTATALLLPTDGATLIAGATVTPLGRRLPVHRTQLHFEQGPRDILRTVSAAAPRLPPEPDTPSFYPPWEYADHAWAMVIDLDRCIGCNACTIACQSENNVPVVGPEEVDRGRIMHWMRVDTYSRDDGAPAFQPVPCMHCEKAPCEPVCPVAASVHDGQGLNVQVYNRCVGTRFCQANCPYKVRRFNFQDYSGAEAERAAPDGAGIDLLAALRNPDVTVRGRGVMEKCTYCVQRIERARHEASRDDEPIPPGAVRTACQDACPTETITFGDLAAETSAIARLRDDPRHYALLGELGTRPRTTYLARVEAGEEDGA